MNNHASQRKADRAVAQLGAGARQWRWGAAAAAARHRCGRRAARPSERARLNHSWYDLPEPCAHACTPETGLPQPHTTHERAGGRWQAAAADPRGPVSHARLHPTQQVAPAVRACSAVECMTCSHGASVRRATVHRCSSAIFGWRTTAPAAPAAAAVVASERWCLRAVPPRARALQNRQPGWCESGEQVGRAARLVGSRQGSAQRQWALRECSVCSGGRHLGACAARSPERASEQRVAMCALSKLGAARWSRATTARAGAALRGRGRERRPLVCAGPEAS